MKYALFTDDRLPDEYLNDISLSLLINMAMYMKIDKIELL